MGNQNSSVAVNDVVFTGNSAEVYGGGLFNFESKPMIANTIFKANHASIGGGMANYGGQTLPEIYGSIFSENTAASSGGGGGAIWSSDGAGLHVDNSAFLANSALPFGQGGAILSENTGEVRVSNSIFTGNSAGDGGAMYNVRSPLVINSVFDGNSAFRGGAMFNYAESPLLPVYPIFLNSTFYGNTADYGSGMFNAASIPTVANCIMWGDTGNEIFNVVTTPIVTYCNIEGGYSGGSNIIDLDPKFANASAGDFRLRPDSPSIDTGTNAGAPSKDIEGNIRPVDGDSDGVAIADMGAYEYQNINRPPVADAGADQTVEQTSPAGAEVRLDGSGSYDPDGDELNYVWTWGSSTATGESPTVLLPAGTVNITLGVSDGVSYSALDTVDITVQDTTPPEVSVLPSPDTLWPPNHEMRDVLTAVSVSDASDPTPVVILQSIVSDESDDGNDIQNADFGAEDYHFLLRAEREGTGDGRVYTITYVATDSSGNAATATTFVVVPLYEGNNK